MFCKTLVTRLTRGRFLAAKPNRGFVLPIALALGMVMVAMSVTSALVAMGDRNSAVRRKESGASALVGEGAMARAMLQLSQPNNSVLLVRNYDSINTKTGKTYLGTDGVPNSGDETGTAVDEWTGYDPSGTPCAQVLGRTAPNLALTGTLSPTESYTIRAYRYDKQQKLGTLLVEGRYDNQSALIAVTLSIEPNLDNFPGILAFDAIPSDLWHTGVVALRGRQVIGSKANVYYYPPGSPNPFLIGAALPGASNRSSYLYSLWSSSLLDGAIGDAVEGKIFACSVTPNIPAGGTGPNLGIINTSTTINGVGGTTPTVYQVDKIDLAHSSTLTVNTTGGPVYINVTDKGNPGHNPDLAITLRNSAKILNIRTDGQSPRVGDLRIMIRGHSQTNLYDQTCIQNAFLFSLPDEVRIFTSGPGCPGGKNTNFEGVIWAEAVLSSKNSILNRPIFYLMGDTGIQYDITLTSGATSGIAVPDDLSSLSDLLDHVNWPAQYKYNAIKKWQRLS